jgi:lipoprotein-releasing system permease protein
MDLADIKKLTLLYNGAVLGGWVGWDEAQGVAIGRRLADKLGVTLGDPVTIVTPNGTITPFGSTPQIRSYPVQVIFDLGMVEFDSFYVYMPMEPAQTYFKMYQDRLKPGVEPPDVMASDAEIDAAYERVPQATAIEVFIDDPDNVAVMRDRIQAAVSRPLILTDWQQRNETFFSALQVERVVMFTILSMIILVAAFNIISSLVMLVKDKGADIAILRTMGATRWSIMRIFSMTGTAIGVIGTFAGLILGLVVAANAESLRAFISNALDITIFPPEVFFLSALPSKIDPVEVTTVVLLALGLSFVATLYPAWRAAQYDPVEALRYE